MRYVFLILFVCFGPEAGLTQTIGKALRTFSTSEGISNKLVTCITKDVRGFLWVGTGEGLNRFDGRHFLNFYQDPINENSLTGNFIYSLLEFQAGKLLIATNRGLSVLDTYTNKFDNSMVKNQFLNKESNTLVRSLFRQKSGQIFINHSGKIEVLSSNLSYLYCLTDISWCKSLQGIIINDGRWFQDNQDRLWIPSDNKGIQVVDFKKKQVYNQQNNPLNFPFFNSQVIRSFWFDETNQWVFYGEYGNGIAKFDLKTNKKDSTLLGISYSGEARSINAIIEHENNLLCFGGQTLFKIDPLTLQFKNVDAEVQGSNSGIFSNCRTAYKEKGNIWVGTESKGIVQLPISPPTSVELSLPYKIIDYSNYCTGITRASDGLIYYAYNRDGLVTVDPNTYETAVYSYKPNSSEAKPIHRICEDGKKRIWIGTNNGILEFDPVKKKFHPTTTNTSALNNVSIFYLFTDSRGDVWISYSDEKNYGIARYEVQQEKLTLFPKYKSGNTSFFDSSKRITRIVEDDRGKIWFVSLQGGGIAYFNLIENKWSSLVSGIGTLDGIERTGLNAIAVYGDTVWLGNSGGLSLFAYNYRTSGKQYYRRKDGLSSENILSISKLDRSRLFLATQAGVNMVNTRENKVYPIVTRNESIDWAFAYIQYYDSLSKQLFFGLNDRMVAIRSSAWNNKLHQPVTYVYKLVINDKEVDIPRNNSTISLSYLQKNPAFEFAAPEFNIDQPLEYAYMLEGADKDWILSKKNNSAKYSSLSPGRYRFKVRAKLYAGEWGPINETVQLIIRPPVWGKPWFIICSSLLAASILALLIRRRIQHIRKEAALRQKISETEMNALRAQMNPHFIFNCLNAIDNLIQTNQKEKATSYLSKFAKLIRSVLDSSKNNVVPFQKDFESLRLYLEMEKFRCGNKFDFQLIADDELMQSDFKVPPLIIQPFVENAILHGLLNKETGARNLSVMARLQKESIKYTIKDTGVGRARALELKNINKPEHESLGLKITIERIQLYNGNKIHSGVNITDLFENNQPAGTCVEVELSIFEN